HRTQPRIGNRTPVSGRTGHAIRPPPAITGRSFRHRLCKTGPSEPYTTNAARQIADLHSRKATAIPCPFASIVATIAVATQSSIFRIETCSMPHERLKKRIEGHSTRPSEQGSHKAEEAQ